MKHWMVFRTEHNFVHYIWNGDNVILIHLPAGIDSNPYYWMGNPSEPPPTKEIGYLNNITATKSKVRIFKVPTRPGLRYVIVAKGQFVEE
jgi:hypothetical protein